MRVHLLSTPNAQTTKAFYLCGFTQMTIRFATVLKRLGHEVWLYGSEDNEAPCDAFIRCITKDQQTKGLNGVPYQAFEFTPDTLLWRQFNATASAHIQSNKQPGDVIATISGLAQKLVSDQNPELLMLEYSIGYQGVFAPYRVYESHIWRHCAHGYTGIDGGREFDTVIPPFFEASEFPFTSRPDPYVVYCGRIVPRKGIKTVCEAAKAAGVPLKVMGHGDPSLITYGEYLGTPPNDERNEVLSKATACLMPTQYLEPFGSVAAEAQLCGTPMITTDYGAFVESVEHGMSGFRCRYLGEFVQAIQSAGELDRTAIRARAQRLYSLEAAEASYRGYFQRLGFIGGDGWNSLERSADAAFEARALVTA